VPCDINVPPKQAKEWPDSPSRATCGTLGRSNPPVGHANCSEYWNARHYGSCFVLDNDSYGINHHDELDDEPPLQTDDSTQGGFTRCPPIPSTKAYSTRRRAWTKRLGWDGPHRPTSCRRVIRYWERPRRRKGRTGCFGLACASRRRPTMDRGPRAVSWRVYRQPYNRRPPGRAGVFVGQSQQ
jgi:hypothetical protein